MEELPRVLRTKPTSFSSTNTLAERVAMSGTRQSHSAAVTSHERSLYTFTVHSVRVLLIDFFFFWCHSSASIVFIQLVVRWRVPCATFRRNHFTLPSPGAQKLQSCNVWISSKTKEWTSQFCRQVWLLKSGWAEDGISNNTLSDLHKATIHPPSRRFSQFYRLQPVNRFSKQTVAHSKLHVDNARKSQTGKRNCYRPFFKKKKTTLLALTAHTLMLVNISYPLQVLLLFR